MKTLAAFILASLTFFTGSLHATESIKPGASSFQDASQVKIPLANGEMKTIRLLNVTLPATAKKALVRNLSLSLAHPATQPVAHSPLGPKVDLGMNGIPVLDQGPWGTCATFATTAAMDAFYPLRGEKAVSELCNLQLGRTLQEVPGADGGWQGSLGYIVLNQISQYGYLPQSWQLHHGCGGLKNYPSESSEDNGSAMPVEEFTAHSIRSFSDSQWKVLYQEYDSSRLFDPERNEQHLLAVKRALASGYRVTFGVLLDPVASHLGISGTYNGVKATWVLTPKILDDIKNDFVAGHAMIITGYDDNACATWYDSSEEIDKTQCGLLTLRNSWSKWAGNHGDYYMTYDYFKNLAIESYQIGNNT